MGPRPGHCRHGGGRGRGRDALVQVALVRPGLPLAGAGWRLPPAGRRGCWRLLRWQWRAWRVARNTRVLNRNVNLLRRMLMSFPGGQLVGQPLPASQRTDDRYELLGKLQGVLRSLHLDGIVVLVDRVDEPYLINGSTELMQAMIWPMLDNKFLKHPGMGVKLLLADRVGAAAGPRGPRFPPAGPPGQAEPHPLAGVDGPIALRPGQRPAEGLCGRGENAHAEPNCSSRPSTSAG